MKKQIIITIILLIATAFVTTVYFKNLNLPGTTTNRVMSSIPNTAVMVFEFNNDKSFYDTFNGSKLFAAVTGAQQLDELNTLRSTLLSNPLLAPYFSGQNMFISLHASKTEITDFMLTIPAPDGVDAATFDQLGKQSNNGLVVTPLKIGNRAGYNIFIKSLKKRFYIINKGDNIFSGSFSKDLITLSAGYQEQKDRQNFVLLSEQQTANSLADLYINYDQLGPLLNRLFINTNTDILKNAKFMPALSALSLNYRTDALMFNGTTNILHNRAGTYLDIFALQQPVINHLKDIFPATTAYSINLSVSNPHQFQTDLEQFQTKAGIVGEKNSLFNKVRSETGVNLKKDFSALLGNEFAVVTTRFFEKIAIISVNDGSKLKTMMTGISTAATNNFAQLSYNKLPFFLLGDAFSVFKRPYYTIIDNYLILATSTEELTSYTDTYLNRKFLSKNDQYNQFDDLLSGRSNVSFFFHFKNAQAILKRDLFPAIYENFETNDPGWKNFYAASWQFTAADHNFYTSLCLRLNTDSVVKGK